MSATILVIDDDLLLVQLLEKALSKAGHRVHAVNDPERGLALLDEHTFDLVITDIKMPKLSGIQVLERVKALDETIEVILFSGAEEERFENAIAALRLGASDFLPKPLRNMDELMVAVERALEKRRLAMNIRELSRSLERMRNADFLTGVNTRRYLLERASVELMRTQRHRKPIACLLADIDHLDQINKTYGRPCGDEVLAHVGRLLMRSTRITDMVGRYGGEEFVLMLPETRVEQGEAAAEKMRKAIETTPFFFGGQEIPVTVSFGVAGATGETGISELVGAALRALEKAKRAGRNCVRTAGVEVGG
ncbi:MAG: diguanylate cyclase [Terriglobia bacterium]